MFDTHCHLNFKAFDENIDGVITDAKNVGINYITIPGTDIVSSQKAIAIAEKHEGIYAAVGIHPHHVYKHHVARNTKHITQEIKQLENIIQSCVSRYKFRDACPIVAIGEIGLDRHMYQKTKYGEYMVNEKFITLQKEFFVAQLELAKKYKKSVIIHNREAKGEILEILGRPAFAEAMARKMVFHCCEPDGELLEFAKEHKIYIGVDGDITYRKDKQEFIKKVPLEMLVLETDSPFLIPEPLKSQKKFPNNPANLAIIAEYVAKLRGENPEALKKQTEENSKDLFNIQTNA